MRIRAVAILIEDNKVVLIERHRADRHYFTFPGGGVDEDETVKQAVLREMMEETGLRVSVKSKVAEIWFQGNRQEYFFVENLGGEFGTGTGEEYTRSSPLDELRYGSYHPLWMPISELLNNPVLPVEMAEMVIKSVNEGWPSEPVIIFEKEK
jgi:8-oxo-dGTP pyrophosphatase MutT (NUDIX family)